MASASPFSSVAATSTSVFGGSSSQRAKSPEPNNHNKPASNPTRSRSPSVSSLNRRKSPPPQGTKPKPGAAFGSYNNTTSFGFGAASRHSPSPSLDASSRKGSLLEANTEEDGGRDSPGGDKSSGGESMKRGASWGEILGTAGADASDEDGKERKKLKVEEVEGKETVGRQVILLTCDFLSYHGRGERRYPLSSPSQAVPAGRLQSI